MITVVVKVAYKLKIIRLSAAKRTIQAQSPHFLEAVVIVLMCLSEFQTYVAIEQYFQNEILLSDSCKLQKLILYVHMNIF